MQITIEMGPEFPVTIEGLSSMAASVVNACSKGMAKAAQFAANKTVSQYLTGQALKVRSNQLRIAVQGWLEKPLDAVVGVRPNSKVEKYKWLLGDEQKTIIPKPPKHALTIPIGEALDPSGRARFESAKQAEQKLGTKFFRLPGTNVLGFKRGKKGKFRALFVLVKSVFVQGSGALYDAVDENIDDMTGIIQSEVDKAIET